MGRVGAGYREVDFVSVLEEEVKPITNFYLMAVGETKPPVALTYLKGENDMANS